MSSMTRTISRSKSRLPWEDNRWAKVAARAARWRKAKADQKEARMKGSFMIFNRGIAHFCNE